MALRNNKLHMYMQNVKHVCMYKLLEPLTPSKTVIHNRKDISQVAG